MCIGAWPFKGDYCLSRGERSRNVPRAALSNLETFTHLPGSVPISSGQGPISSWKDSLSIKGQTSTLSKVPSFLWDLWESHLLFLTFRHVNSLSACLARKGTIHVTKGSESQFVRRAAPSNLETFPYLPGSVPIGVIDWEASWTGPPP